MSRATNGWLYACSDTAKDAAKIEHVPLPTHGRVSNNRGTKHVSGRGILPRRECLHRGLTLLLTPSASRLLPLLAHGHAVAGKLDGPHLSTTRRTPHSARWH